MSASFFIVPGVVLWCGVVIALTRPFFDIERMSPPKTLTAIRRGVPWLLPLLSTVCLPLGIGLPMWKLVSLNQTVGPFGGIWTIAIVCATIGAASFSAHAHLPGRSRRKSVSRPLDRDERKKLAAMMSEVPEKEPRETYVPVSQRPRTINLDEVLKRRTDPVGDGENGAKAGNDREEKAGDDREAKTGDSPDARLA